jgi:hypothetical protein
MVYMVYHTLWYLHCISFIALAYGVISRLLAATVPVQHRLSMRLHTLLGMRAGDMAFALHMHYDFGLWHICLGFRLWKKH